MSPEIRGTVSDRVAYPVGVEERKKKRKPSRGPGFAHTHIIQKAIFQVFLYILTLGKADLIYCMLLFPANPTLKSQGQQQNTFQEYNSCSDKRINNF